MNDITKLKGYSSLKKQQVFLSDTPIKKLFEEDQRRVETFSKAENKFFLDYSKTHTDEKTFSLLNKLGEDCELEKRIKNMFAGERVNETQGLPALHFAWRAPDDADIRFEGRCVMPEIIETREAMKKICEDVHKGSKHGASGKRFFDIVHVGIGGSSLPVKYMTEGLKRHKKAGFGLHFIETADGSELKEIKQKLQPDTTLFVIASKSFRTPETLLNAAYIKEWIDDKLGTGAYRHHMIGATAQIKNAHQFGILEENIVQFKNWVVGRFGSFSPIALSVALSVGWETYERAMQGAYLIDRTMKENPVFETMAYKMAQISIWYRMFWNTTTEGIFPYTKTLAFLPNVIEMLSLESNGKASSVVTAPWIIKGLGTEVEHFLFQKYLQNPELTLSTFILSEQAEEKGLQELHKTTAYHAFAFSEALAIGREKTKEMEPHEICFGNQPSMTLLCKDMSPETIGALVALYEYKTIVESAFYGVNPFDNFGAEAGKKITQNLLQKGLGLLSSTNALVARLES